MVTYIKQTVKGHYVPLDEELNPELYTNIGETWEDYLNNKWVKLSDEQLKFKDKHHLATLYEVFNMKINVVEEPSKTIESAKKETKENILNYDSSEYVNIFYIQTLPVWLDKATRAGLKLRFEAEIANGQTETTLWYDNMQFPLTLENAMKMLFAIELYASACYDNTQHHLAEVNKLENIQDILEYDYKTGYPEKLNF